jgi:hypothetical protein
VRGTVREASQLAFEVFSVDGHLVQRSSGTAQGRFEKRIATADLPDGGYMVVVRDGTGSSVGTARFQVKH